MAIVFYSISGPLAPLSAISRMHCIVFSMSAHAAIQLEGPSSPEHAFGFSLLKVMYYAVANPTLFGVYKHAAVLSQF